MKTKNNVRRIAVLATLASCSAILTFGTNVPSASAELQGADAGTRVGSEAVLYAAELNLSLSEADAALQAQEAMHPVKEAINLLVGDGVIEVRTVHEPEIHLQVIVQPSAPVKSLEALLSKSGFQYELDVVAQPSRAALRRIVDTFSRPWVQRWPEIQGLGTDGENAAVTVDAFGSPSRLAAMESSLNADIGDDRVTVHINTLPAPNADLTRGGLPAFNGAGDPACTLGFSVRSTGGAGRGVSSAGHCENGGGLASYRTFETNDSRALNFADRRFNSSTDLSWYRISATAVGQFYPAKGSPARTVTRTLGADEMDGDSICHRGRTTDQSCGFVQDTSYNPGGGCPGGCDSTYVSVTGQFLACAGGDSGGPWYADTTAYGNLKGGASIGVGNGDCAVSYFTPGRRFSTMNMEIIVP